MASTPQDYPTSYWAANTKVMNARDHSHLTLSGTETMVHSVRHGDEWAYAVRYHYTDVVTFYLGGDILLNTGGWNTLTTHRKMSACLENGRVSSNAGWSIYSFSLRGTRYVHPFSNTLLIHRDADGTITLTADSEQPVTYGTTAA